MIDIRQLVNETNVSIFTFLLWDRTNHWVIIRLSNGYTEQWYSFRCGRCDGRGIEVWRKNVSKHLCELRKIPLKMLKNTWRLRGNKVPFFKGKGGKFEVRITEQLGSQYIDRMTEKTINKVRYVQGVLSSTV